MKSILVIIALFISTNIFAQDFNTVMNNNIYLLRETNKNLSKYDINNVEIYSGDSLHATLNVSESTEKIKDIIDWISTNSNVEVNKVTLVSKSDIINVDTKDSYIKFDTLSNLTKFANDQIDYMIKIKNTTHNRGSISFNNRIRLAGFSTDGVFSENCSGVTFYNGSDYSLSIKILKSYFNGRNKTGHWNGLMRDVYKYCETSYTKSGNMIYSLTTYHSRLTYSVK